MRTKRKKIILIFKRSQCVMSNIDKPLQTFESNTVFEIIEKELKPGNPQNFLERGIVECSIPGWVYPKCLQTAFLLLHCFQLPPGVTSGRHWQEIKGWREEGPGCTGAGIRSHQDKGKSTSLPCSSSPQGTQRFIFPLASVSFPRLSLCGFLRVENPGWPCYLLFVCLTDL